jgi:hypothetical protein
MNKENAMTLRLNPELMVIGDSLAQGCRTLSVSENLCAQSYANIIAKSQGWEFEYPRHPQPILFDLEEEIRKLRIFSIIGGVGRLRRNLDAWSATFENQSQLDVPIAYDNLAIAGVSIAEMNEFTAGANKEQLLDDLFPNMIGQSLREIFERGTKAHLAINAAFVLNPQGGSAHNSKTQLDWVEQRQPKRLIAHFGHNDGLYRIGGSADLTEFNGNYDNALGAYKEVVYRLADLPKAVKKIVIVLHPKVSAVANLRPNGTKDANGYHAIYTTQFPLPGEEIKGTLLRRADDAIKAFNRSIRKHVAALPNANRFCFVDTYRILEKYDFKNTTESRRQIETGAQRIDNRYLEGVRKRRPGRPNGPPKYRFQFKHGGLFSLDGMHLSAIGYAVLACEIMNKMDLIYDKGAILKQAFQNEDLVSRYNRSIHSFLSILDFVEDLRPTDDEESASDLRIEAALGLAEQPFLGHV